MTSEAERQLIDAFDAIKAEAERLEAALAEARRDVEEAAGELPIPIDECPPGSNMARVCIANRIIKREREALLGRAVDAEREVERLRAELADRDARIAAARETLLLALHLREAKEG